MTKYIDDNDRYEKIEYDAQFEQIAGYVATFSDSSSTLGIGATDVSVEIGENRSGVAGYILRTSDDAGGDNDLRGYVFENEADAIEFAKNYARKNDVADGKSAEDFLGAAMEAEAVEDEDGEFAVYWETVGEDADVVSRHADFEAASAAAQIRQKNLEESNPGDLLCGYGVRVLVDGEWVETDEYGDARRYDD